MKKFITKTAIFVIPFFLLFVIKILFYSSSESPDLLRLGYFPNVFRDYRKVFNKEFNRKIYFHEVSKTKNRKSKILTIGDSFSEQGNFGYKNYLAEKYDVLHIDRFVSKNQIQILSELINGDFFEKYDVEYVLIENVERYFVENVISTDISKKLMTSQLDSIIRNHKPVRYEENYTHSFFSKKSLDFAFHLIQYYINNNYLSNEMVYNVTLKTNNLFSINSNKLFFYQGDLSSVKQNNDFIEIRKLNDFLNNLSNKLKHKKVKLIVLPAPDKYDLYYDYIADKRNFERPLFFKHLTSFNKKYIYIDSKKFLSAQLKIKKDIYFYDDTHWSPVASKIISDEIIKLIIDQE